MKITKTKNGLRLTEHGVVISELRTFPGPTHSVFDVLAATIAVFAPTGRVGMLGFAAGGMMAPLRGLGVQTVVEAVDLSRDGYDLFQRHCRPWRGRLKWRQADAVAWLRRQAPTFDLLVEDLSMSRNGDVIKPSVSWDVLPVLIRRRLRQGGVAVFNLLPPAGGRWDGAVEQVAALFHSARLVTLDEFENRILVCGDVLPNARELGAILRRELARLHSRQARRLRLRTMPGGGKPPQTVARRQSGLVQRR
jgi:spermidine synthase